MAETIDKAVKELSALFKKETSLLNKKLTYWNLLKNNLAEEGTWDDDILDSAKDRISTWLGNLKQEDLQSLWNDSESATGYEEDETIENDFMLSELSEELLDLILEQIEEITPREEFFIDETKSKKNKYSDDNEDDFDIDDDIFDDDDFEDLDDDFYDDDDSY